MVRHRPLGRLRAALEPRLAVLPRDAPGHRPVQPRGPAPPRPRGRRPDHAGGLPARGPLRRRDEAALPRADGGGRVVVRNARHRGVPGGPARAFLPEPRLPRRHDAVPVADGHGRQPPVRGGAHGALPRTAASRDAGAIPFPRRGGRDAAFRGRRDAEVRRRRRRHARGRGPRPAGRSLGRRGAPPRRVDVLRERHGPALGRVVPAFAGEGEGLVELPSRRLQGARDSRPR